MKNKVINDPVHGFISINNALIFKIIEHPYFQRLRRIKQLGLTDFVYPGALHTRFHHALGAYHLMSKALFTLRQKGVEITDEEFLGAQIAILLHDIGHGPFSHTLEHTLIKGVSHESISLLYMEKLNEEFNGALGLAINIFKNQYDKKFLHQLVSGQLDVDRLDYLTRDSFFTGVSEGVINYHRIIDMMNVVNNELVVEEKGIYSIEKFLISRRIMYWQVYLHKTVVCAEEMLIKIIERAKYLLAEKKELPGSESLAYFLERHLKVKDLLLSEAFINHYSLLDDIDILAALKQWQNNEDNILQTLCKMLLNRNLFKIKMSDEPLNEKTVEKRKKELEINWNLKKDELKFVFIQNSLTSYLYNPKQTQIKILGKNGKLKDFAKASDQWSAFAMQKPVSKYYYCYLKE